MVFFASHCQIINVEPRIEELNEILQGIQVRFIGVSETRRANWLEEMRLYTNEDKSMEVPHEKKENLNSNSFAASSGIGEYFKRYYSTEHLGTELSVHSQEHLRAINDIILAPQESAPILFGERLL